MSRKEEFFYESSSGTTNIHAVMYIPDGEVKAVLQIAHGMAEYIERYEGFAEYMASRGVLVAGNDHLGHGKSVNTEDDYGYFADDDGNIKVLSDVHKLTKIVKEKYPGLPYFLMGHSMGSFYCRQYLFTYGAELDGAIVMGTGCQPAAIVKAGRFITRVVALFKGWHYRSTFVDNMAFGSYNSRFEPARTKFDWLTKDERIVDKYVSDKLCGFVFTLNGFFNMFTGISRLYDKDLLNQMPKELPVLFVSGEDDPVGDFGEGVKRAVKSFKDVGMKNVDMRLYGGDRHEILNEFDKDKVCTDIFAWLCGVTEKAAK